MSFDDLLRALERDPDEWSSAQFRDRLAAAPVAAPFPAVNAAIRLRDHGRYAAADVIFARILDQHPDYLFALHDYSVSCARQGRLEQAADLSRRAWRQDQRLSIAANHALILAALGRSDASAEVLAGVQAEDLSAQAELAATLQFARYLGRFPHRAARAVALDAEADPRFAAAAAVADDILQAAAERRPFSMLRLGDGEGAWTLAGLAEETDYAVLYEANRRSFLTDWFGDDSLYGSAAFLRTARDLWRWVEEADLIGIPPASRIDHEYLVLSARGAPSCNNLLRRLGFWSGEASGRYCSHHVAHQLADTGFFDRLWTSGSPVGLITSHRGLGALVRGAGAPLAFEHHTPGDNRNPWLDAATGIRLQHYPDVFEQVLTRLTGRDLRGVVVLVGAGFVGKAYCSAVRRGGGVAVDLGSVLDGWAAAGALP